MLPPLRTDVKPRETEFQPDPSVFQQAKTPTRLYSLLRPFFLFATPPTAAVLFIAAAVALGTSPAVPELAFVLEEAGCNGPLETVVLLTPAFPLVEPAVGSFSFVLESEEGEDEMEVEPLVESVDWETALCAEDDVWRGSAPDDSSIVRGTTEPDLDRGFEVTDGSAGARDGPGTGAEGMEDEVADALEEEGSWAVDVEEGCCAEGMLNSGGLFRGVACTDVITFACLKYSS